MTQPPKDPIESRRKLHQLLLDEKLYSKSDAEFETQFANPESRVKLHQLLLDKNLYSKSADDFDAQFFGDLLKKKDVTLDLRFPGQVDLSQPISNDGQVGSVDTRTLEQQLTTAPPREEPELDFGTMNLDEIEDELSKNPPAIVIPGSFQQPNTDIQSQLRVPANERELAQNRFEAKKDRIRDLSIQEKKARYAEDLQKFSEGAIKKLDEEIAKLPSNISFEDTGMGGVSVPKDEKREMLEMAKSILENVRDTPDQGGFWEGLSSKGIVGVLPFISSLEELPRLRNLQKVSTEAYGFFKGENDAPSKEEQQLLSAEQIRREFEKAKEQPSSYRWGRILAEMIPYMGEYVATAGVYTGAKAAVTTGLKQVLKSSAEKAIVKNGIIKPISTLVALSAQTSANPTRVANTTFERMTPQLKLTLGLEPEDLQGMGLEAEKFGEAFSKAFGVNAMELLTERFGQWSSEAGDAIKAAGYWLPNITLGRWMEKRGLVNLAEANKAARALGWDGVIKEVWFEEYPNKLLQNAITGDEEWNPDFFNPLAPEFIDMVVPSLILGGGPMAYGAAKKFAENRQSKQFEKDIADLEKEVTVSPGDLGVKPKVDEKPKEQVGEVVSKPLPKDVQKEGVQVQAQQEVKGEKVKGTDLIKSIDKKDENFEAIESAVKDKVFTKAKVSIDDLVSADKDLQEYLKDNKAEKGRSIEIPVIVGDIARGGDIQKNAVIDGFHRIAQAVANGETEIDAYVAETTGETPVIKPETKSPEGQVQEGEISGKAEAGVSKKESAKYTVDVAKLQDDGSVKRIKQEVEGKPYKKYPSLGLFSHSSVDTEGYYTISEQESGIQVVKAKTKKEAEQKLDELVTRYGGEEAFKGVMAEQIAKVQKNQKAEEQPNKNLAKDLIAEREKAKEEYVPKDGWKNNIIKAREYAKELGLEFKGKELDEIVSNIKDLLKKPEVKPNVPVEKAELGMPIKEETFGKFKVIGVNAEGNKVGEDKNGVRGVLKGNVIVSQPVGVIPGQGISVSSPEGQFMTTEESKKKAYEIAFDNGFDSPAHLINSVKKRTGQEYKTVQEIPKEVINRVVNERNLEELPPAEEKPKITKIKEANPERILVVKPTSDIKGVTEIKYEDDGDTILYGAKNNKTRVSVKGLTKERIQEELDFERESLARIKKQVSEFDEQKILSSKGLSDQEKQDAIKLNKQTKNNIDAVEKIVIPFYESKIEPKAPRKSDAKFEKARKSAAELLDLIGTPNTEVQGAYDFSASSNSGKWNSANASLESQVQNNRKAFSIYKFLIGDLGTFKEIVDFINEKTGLNIEYTPQMKRADEMSVDERKSAIDSYNNSALEKTDTKYQSEKDVLTENGLKDETEYYPKELIEKFKLTGVQKAIWNLISAVVEKLGIKVKFSSSRITDGFDGSNNPLTGEVLIRPSTLKNGRFGEVLVHEVVHALTTKIISRVNSGVTTGLTPQQVKAVKGLMKLFEAVKADNNLENKYPVKDIFEFIAHLTNDSFVKELESKDRTFLQKVYDYILDILGVNNANELSKQYLKDIISDGTFLQENGITVLPSDYGNKVQGSQQADPQKNQKIIIKAGEVVANYIDAGVTRIAEMMQDILATYGEAGLRTLFDPMKKGYGSQLASAENIDEMDEIKTVRTLTVEDILKTQDGSISNTDGTGTSELPGGAQSEGTGNVAEGKPVESETDEGSGASTTSAGGSTKAGKKRGGSAGGGNRKGTGTGLEPSGTAGDEQGTTGKGRKELNVNDQNHVIQEGDDIVPTGETAKIRANIAAIRLVKKLQEENRNATPEEKKILAKFVGWGGLASVLDKQKARNGWDDNWNKKYENYHKDIADLLTDEEFNNAVNSTINAHYTDRRVITSIWDLVKRLGFTGGNVMEPSAGVGHFFGLMPQEMAQNSNLKAYELDKITGQILSKLYPEASVRVTGYEEAVEGSNTQDLVISNVPFGKTAPFDVRYKDLSKFSLHNYFIAKGIQQLKPGGLGVFITSSSSMDNGASANFREWTNNQGNADFIGAIRLPNNAFSENAGTQVTTDLLIYKKRTSETAGEFNEPYRVSVSFKETKDSKGEPVEIFVNEYFKRNPEMMLGEMMLAHEAGSGGLYSADSQTLKAPAGQNTVELMADRISRFPENVFGAEVVEEKETEKADLGDKEGTLKEQGGKLYFVENGELHLQPWGSETIKSEGKTYKKSDVVKDYSGIKVAVNDLIQEEQNKENNDVRLEELRKELNKKYDGFVKKYGKLNRNNKLEFLEEDADHISVTSLENVVKESTINEKTGRVTTKFDIAKADIFKKRVNFPYTEPEKADSPSDAVSISLSYRNKIDLPYIASLLNISEESAKRELIDNNLVYENPKTGLLEESDSYLSGYVRTKLAEAEAEVKANPDYERNVEALKKVVPKNIPAQLIEFRLGSNWLPGSIIDNWIKNAIDVETQARYNPLTGSWILGTSGGTYGDKNRITYGTKKFTAIELIEKALNLRQPEVVNVFKEPGGGTRSVKDLEATAEAQGKMQELADMFYNYVKGNKEDMSKLEVLFNEKYNDFIEKKQSLPAFTYFPNANHDTTLRLHQRRGVMRSLNDSTLLAHQVGTGKTFTLITIAMEMRRLRIAKKPMIVVQNATIEQFTEKFKELYPASKILMPSKKEMDTKNRQKLFNKIAYNDWDAVIIPQSFINFIPDDAERERAYLSEQIAELEIALDEAKEAGDRGAISDINATMKKLDTSMGKLKESKGRKVKDVAKSNLAAEKAMKRQSSRRKDDVINFENMGVDALLVDEAHAYKKLGFFTKMNKIRGIDTGRSQRAFGIMMKIKYIQEKNKGKNVIFSTGTPITNTMAEIWTMMRYISPDVLEKYNIKGFDEFASTFGNVEPSLEFTASGSFKIVDRFKSYINAPELLTAFRSKTDVVLTEDIPEFKEDNSIPKLKEQPDGKRSLTQITMPQTKSLLDFMDWAKATLKAWEKLPGKEKRKLRHVPLMVFNRAKQAAIDMRLLKPTNIDDPDSKTNRVVKEAKRIYDETNSYQGTQLIFSDMYQSPEVKDKFLDEEGTLPNPAYGLGRFNLYEDIKKKLVKLGIPEKEIAVINDYEGEKRNALFDNINNGTVRILLGSTEKMGVGVNVQERLAGLHHIDAPPRPMDFEQRNGRIIRQGNLHAKMDKPIEIVTYGVEKTLDATAYQRLAIKQKFINQMMKAEGIDRNMNDAADEEDAGDMTFDQMMSTLSGSQYAVLHTQKMYDLRKLRTAKNNHTRNIIEYSDQITRNKRSIEFSEQKIQMYEPIQGEFKSTFPEGKIKEVEINGKKFSGKEISENVQKYIDDKLKEVDKSGMLEAKGTIKIDGGTLVTMDFRKTVNTDLATSNETKWNYHFKYSIVPKSNPQATVEPMAKITTGVGLITSINNSISKVIEKGDFGMYDIVGLQNKIDQQKKDVKAMVELLDKPFDKTDKLAALEADVADLEEKMKGENKEVDPEKEALTEKIDPDKEEQEDDQAEKSMDDILSEGSKKAAKEGYEGFNGAMSTVLPLPVVGKVKKAPSDQALLNFLATGQMTMQEMTKKLDEETKFENSEVEKRVNDAQKPEARNVSKLWDQIKLWAHETTQPLKYLNVNKWAREANLLREFKGIMDFAKAKSTLYVKTLTDNLTPIQYRILSRRIWLADLLESVQKGENMRGIDGKFSFGFNSEEEIQKHFDKYDEFMRADDKILDAYKMRQAFMGEFKKTLVDSGLLQETDIDNYYHRRIKEYQADQQHDRSILFGREIGDKKRGFQKQRTGTRGLDYSTNFIETDWKVVTEGLYEIEKRKILNDLMSPFEKQLNAMLKEFKTKYDAVLDQLTQVHGEDSQEVKSYKRSKKQLKTKFLDDNKPEGYVLWRTDESNRLFWGKSVTQAAIDKAIDQAQQNDNSGVGLAMNVIEGLINDLRPGLMVGSKRKQYMIPAELAKQLDFMAENEQTSTGSNIANRITGEWKKLVLLSPFRLVRYNINNLGSDIDRTIQVEPRIAKYSVQSAKELWEYTRKGVVTPQILEAIRGGVIDSGFQISEIADVSEQTWAKALLEGGTMDKLFGKELLKDFAKKAANTPGTLWSKYLELVTPYVQFRENVLRYAAYKRAVERIDRGDKFYWASNQKDIDAIEDKRQRAAKLAREVYGDYRNISVTGESLRRLAMPFYSWFEINMKTHYNLLKNAGDPKVQRAMIRSAILRGIPAITVRIGMAYFRIAMFTAAVQLWNEFAYGIYGGDDDSENELRRSGSKGMGIIYGVDEKTGHMKVIPVQGAFYDFMEFFGIPVIWEDIEKIMYGENPWAGIKDTASTVGSGMGNRAFQMLSPIGKTPIELLSGQSYFPNVSAPVPIRDKWEYVAKSLTMGDEYNYFLTDKPQKESYLSRKLNNSLFIREIDIETLTYYHARAIVQDYTGKKISGSDPKNPTAIAKKDAEYKFMMALKNNRLDLADKYILQYQMNGGNPRDLHSSIKNMDPLSGLGKKPKPGEMKSEYDDLQGMMAGLKPTTYFGKQLTKDDVLVFKDAMKYFYKMEIRALKKGL